MFIEIPPCSPDHLSRVVFRGSLPMSGSMASRLEYFRNGPQLLVLDFQYSTFRY